jgi:ABC-type Fe3+-hydroxamate transport system substrate-binding protein
VYSLVFSKLFDNDIAESIDYIADALHNPAAALRLLDEADQKLIEIKNNPRYRPLVNDKYLANLGYRFAIAKNYLLFYIIGDGDQHIKIVRFLYSR